MNRIGPRLRIPGVVYQTDERLEHYTRLGLLTDRTLASQFRDVAQRWADRVALSEFGWTCTYAELDVLTDRLGSALRRLGLETYDRVLFQLPNCKELVIAVLGCLKAGLIPVCTLAAHRKIEISYLGRHAGARAHFVPGVDGRFDYLGFSREMRSEIPTLEFTIATGATPEHLGSGFHSFDALIASEKAVDARFRIDAVEHDPYQVALFQLSGGTTDVPKIIPRFNNEYAYTMQTMVDRFGFDQTLVAFTPNPMMHNAPMACVWGPAIFFGGEVAVSRTLDVSEVGPLLASRNPNWYLLPPVLLMKLREAGWLDKLDLSKTIGFGTTQGRPRMQAMLGGAPVWPLFGMTEGILAYGDASDPEVALNETVGRPLSAYDEVEILRPGSEELVPDGEVGELAIRGPCTIRGYFDAEERNRTAFTSDGFYRSGDLMRIRAISGRRYLVFEGRIKDVVDRGGEKINCEEVERFAILHPAIMAIAVVAMPDKTYGEKACAFVIPAPGQSIDVNTLGAFLQEKGLAKFKWPERVEIVSEFPLTSSGKLSKPLLRSAIAEKLKAQG